MSTIQHQNLTFYETGYSFPSLEILYEISRVLSTSVDYLLGFSNNPIIYKDTEKVQLTDDDYRIFDQLKKDKDLYDFLSKNPEKGTYYIYKIWKLMDEWKKEE